MLQSHCRPFPHPAVIIPLEGMTATFGALRNEILVVEDY
ncbi:MAG: hypothetical protein RL318_2970, partial [Fibrobacterota bacterium]